MDFRHPSSKARSTVTSAGKQTTVTRSRLVADRKKARHAGLFEAIRRLDTSLDAAQRQALSDWIRGEYERDEDYADIPLGFVSVCHLGPPYVDHRLNLAASIVDHFSAAQRMPEPFESARMMIRTGGYEFLEVYVSGRIVAVRPDGTPIHSPAQEPS